MIRKITLIYLLFMCFQYGNAQNLITDSGVNNMPMGGCPRAFLAINYSNDWYIGGGTVDFFVGGCIHKLNPTGPNPWPFADYPNSGNGFLGIWGAYKTDFTTGSELVGTELLEPLNAEQFYYFSIDTRYRGQWHPRVVELPVHCEINPSRGLEVYTSVFAHDIETVVDGEGTAIEVKGAKVLSLSSSATTDSIATFDWSTLTGCFQASGGERQLGVSLTIDNYVPVYPCDTNRYEDEWFALYYFNLDNVYLIPFPKATVDTLLLCSEKGKVDFDITTYFDENTLEAVTFLWKDGFEGTKRAFEEPGTYYIDAVLECGTIPFEIYVEEKKCEAIAFVPNAFTPNYDGQNDELHPFLNVDYPISNYRFMIFDRWGNIIYTTKEYDGFTGWDGRINGKEAGKDVYLWALEFDLMTEEIKHYQLSGDVLLMR